MRTARDILLAAVVATIAGCSPGGAPCDAEMGWPKREMPDLDMLVGETAETPLADHFSRAECIRSGHSESSDWEVESSDPAAVAVSVSADGQTLTTAAVSVADSVRVTVQSIFTVEPLKPENPDAYHEFFVRVRPRPPGR